MEYCDLEDIDGNKISYEDFDKLEDTCKNIKKKFEYLVCSGKICKLESYLDNLLTKCPNNDWIICQCFAYLYVFGIDDIIIQNFIKKYTDINKDMLNHVKITTMAKYGQFEKIKLEFDLEQECDSYEKWVDVMDSVLKRGYFCEKNDCDKLLFLSMMYKIYYTTVECFEWDDYELIIRDCLKVDIDLTKKIMVSQYNIDDIFIQACNRKAFCIINYLCFHYNSLINHFIELFKNIKYDGDADLYKLLVRFGGNDFDEYMKIIIGQYNEEAIERNKKIRHLLQNNIKIH